jgi:hypothetical protein
VGFTNVSIGRRNELFFQEGLDDPNQFEFARQISVYVKSNCRPAGSKHAAIAAWSVVTLADRASALK